MPFDGWLCFPAGHAALGYEALGYEALGVDARKRLMGGLFVFFAFGGETGLINENEGDIQGTPQSCGRGGIGRRAALRSRWANPRGSSSLLGRTNSVEILIVNLLILKHTFAM